jgi:hypothetical protein
MLPSELSKTKEHSFRRKWIESNLERITQKAYFFFTEPSSSRFAFAWSVFMALLVVMIAVFYILATCDGPNHYTDRTDMSSYPKLPDEAMYILIDIILWSPICIDTFFRAVMLIAVFTLNGTDQIADDFRDDTFKIFLHAFDFLSVIPFMIKVIYLDPYDIEVQQFAGISLRAFDLLSFSKILRITKDLNAVLAVRLALGKSMVHLVIPLFFFLVFNIFFGVVLYFLEPCYNIDVCAWKNLFEACFFSVVTMTTSKTYIHIHTCTSISAPSFTDCACAMLSIFLCIYHQSLFVLLALLLSSSISSSSCI